MKNLKRTLAVFVSAIMVMAMLAGCGSSSIGSQLRDKTGAGVSTDANSVAITLVEKKAVSEDNVVAAVKAVAVGDTVTPIANAGELTSVGGVKVQDKDSKTGKVYGIYYAFTVTSTDDNVVVTKVNSVFENVEANTKAYYNADAAEYYIGASTLDADKGTYVVVIYVDVSNASTSTTTTA